VALEVLLPALQVGADGDHETDVIEARSGLGDDLALVGVVPAWPTSSPSPTAA
jgi:hypothetical protein